MKRFGAVVTSVVLALGLASCGDGAGAGGESGTIRVALGDIESVETLALFIALERVRDRGTEVELIELADEDLANQAVVAAPTKAATEGRSRSRSATSSPSRRSRCSSRWSV